MAIMANIILPCCIERDTSSPPSSALDAAGRFNIHLVKKTAYLKLM